MQGRAFWKISSVGENQPVIASNEEI